MEVDVRECVEKDENQSIKPVPPPSDLIGIRFSLLKCLTSVKPVVLLALLLA